MSLIRWCTLPSTELNYLSILGWSSVIIVSVFVTSGVIPLGIIVKPSPSSFFLAIPLFGRLIARSSMRSFFHYIISFFRVLVKFFCDTWKIIQKWKLRCYSFQCFEDCFVKMCGPENPFNVNLKLCQFNNVFFSASILENLMMMLPGEIFCLGCSDILCS